MRFVKLLLALLVVGALTATVSAGDYNRFGKGALSIGATPPGVSSSGGYVYSRQYVQPAPVAAAAPVVATAPGTDRRAFSAEPSTAQPPAAQSRRTFSAEPTIVSQAAPAVRTSRGTTYDRFGKGPTTVGLTPPGFSR